MRWYCNSRDVRPSLSVCPSICLAHSDIVSKRTKLALFMVSSLMPDGEREDSSFCKYPVHPEIRKGSLRARAFYETGSASNGLASSGFQTNLLGSLQS